MLGGAAGVATAGALLKGHGKITGDTGYWYSNQHYAEKMKPLTRLGIGALGYGAGENVGARIHRKLKDQKTSES